MAALLAIGAVAPAIGADLPAQPVTAAAQSEDQRYQLTYNSEFRYVSFSGTRGLPTQFVPLNGQRGGGEQFYNPFGLSLVGLPSDDVKIEALVRSGYVHSRQTTAGLPGVVDTFTDTVVSGTATYNGINGIQPFFSLNLNLPTGRSALYGFQANARLDPDLVDVPVFGEGLNIGPTLGVNIPVNETFLITASAGYTHRGTYLREGNRLFDEFGTPIGQATNLFDPSSIFAANLGFAYQVGALTLQVQGSYQTENETLINNILSFRAGDRYLVTANASYALSDIVTATLSGSYAHSERNEVRDPTGTLPGLVVEAFNSNNDVFRIGLDTAFQYGDVALGPTINYLHRDRNSFDSRTFQFIPAKDRIAAGGFLRYNMTERTSINLTAEYIRVVESESPDKLDPVLNAVLPGTGLPSVSQDGVRLVAGGSVRF